MRYRIVGWGLLLTALASGQVHADWIKAHFSPKAKVDSINRFLVLSDTKDSTFFGYGIVPAGDINKDGLQDVIICRSKNTMPYADDSAFLYLGGRPPGESPVRAFAKFKFWMGNIGDVNRDGYDDFGMIDLPYTNYLLFHGGSGEFDTTFEHLNGFFSHIARAADLDGDGKLEIAVSKDLNGGFVYVFTVEPKLDTIPKYIIPDTATSFGSNLATGDFNGDGWSDLAVSACYNRDTEFVNFYWGGPQFDTVQDWSLRKAVPPDHLYGFGKTLFSAGDFNGDGIEDIYIGSNYPEACGVHFGGAHIHTKPDVTINSDLGGGYNVLVCTAPAGDVNHDGYPDIVSSYPFPDETIYIHLGGPDADSIPDVAITVVQVPGFQFGFGYAVTGVGDFNGDGIDDFPVYSKTDVPCCWRSEVNFFAGWDASGTDVPSGGGALPRKFRLNQNYPNPFNSSTKIPFELLSRGKVTLRIINMLGQTVRTLDGGEMSRGQHELEWDGTDNTGASAPSGVYSYELLAGSERHARKLLLLK